MEGLEAEWRETRFAMSDKGIYLEHLRLVPNLPVEQPHQ
jgi:hypothetical protein